MSGDQAAATQWRDAYERVVALAAEAGDAGLSVTVPACPDWTARELLAHMVGVGADALSGDVPEDLNADWTQGQIEQRADASTAQLLAEWAGVADDVEAFLAEKDTSPLGDVIIHEQDLRSALGEPGAQETAGSALVRATMIEKFAAGVADTGASAPLVLEATDDDWSWSSGAAEPGAVVRAPLYDLSRAIISRRTADQLRSWTTSGSVEPYLPAFGGLGPLPGQPLPE